MCRCYIIQIGADQKCSHDWFHELKCTKRIGKKWRKWFHNLERLPCCIPILTILGYADSFSPFHKPKDCGLGEVPWKLPVPTNQVKGPNSTVFRSLGWVGLDNLRAWHTTCLDSNHMWNWEWILVINRDQYKNCKSFKLNTSTRVRFIPNLWNDLKIKY